MPTNAKCLTPECKNQQTGKQFKGLCMSCYSQAKKKVDANLVTWEALAEMDLAATELTPFERAFQERFKVQ